MSLPATVVLAGDDGAARPAGPGDPPFLASLVERLHAEFGVDRLLVRRLATAVLDGFATARVQTFVPILVEKNLRAAFRSQGEIAAARGAASPVV
ncbi:three-helix bundle dimerization domain-containing protein [Blastococcus litoris]|uniref:three-helix bundle dimerization domain-containing protein n=1 Tax=Blastococcus litoris TaxID=2171622 RepID=UPI000E30520E|nr:hypothetical protein [Blastococcus litoris]